MISPNHLVSGKMQFAPYGILLNMINVQTSIPASERLIVALDVDTKVEAMDIVHKLGDTVSFYKVGLQLFMEAGQNVVTELIQEGKKVFLDLKIDDTPRTVEKAVNNVTVEGLEFFTLQGNGDTVKAADRGRGNRTKPKFLQVTVLSSWDTSDFVEHLQLSKPESFTDSDFNDRVVARTSRILKSGCDGVIASGQSVGRIRKEFGDQVIIVTPGIRPEGSKRDDHKRSLTPREAISLGSDYLVVGRPIRNSKNQKKTAQEVIKEIEIGMDSIES
jgi:orotidine-5'-phosphate decarboxylase